MSERAVFALFAMLVGSLADDAFITGAPAHSIAQKEGPDPTLLARINFLRLPPPLPPTTTSAVAGLG